MFLELLLPDRLWVSPYSETAGGDSDLDVDHRLLGAFPVFATAMGC